MAGNHFATIELGQKTDSPSLGRGRKSITSRVWLQHAVPAGLNVKTNRPQHGEMMLRWAGADRSALIFRHGDRDRLAGDPNAVAFGKWRQANRAITGFVKR